MMNHTQETNGLVARFGAPQTIKTVPKPLVAALALLVALITTLPLSTRAQADFQAGMEAYEKGDYETAFKEWEPLAKGGDAEAQSPKSPDLGQVTGTQPPFLRPWHFLTPAILSACQIS